MTSAAKISAGEPRRRRRTGAPSTRRRSAHATRALGVFKELRRYFTTDAQLALALGWDGATVADWSASRVVRPQRAKLLEVLLLAELCHEARAYLGEDHEVGAWATAPMPNLRGETPAGWLRAKRSVGLRQLTFGMVDWMPRLPEEDLDLADVDDLDAALPRADEQDEGVREFRRMLADLG